MTPSLESAGARLVAILHILAAIAGLFITAALIGALVVPHLPEALRTPVLGLSLWGGVLTGGLMLRLSKTSYRDIGFTSPKSLAVCAAWVIAAIILCHGGALLIGEALRRYSNWLPLDVGYIRASIAGNTTAYLVWMVLVVWGSAAFGEELLNRGFIMNRLQQVFGAGPVGITMAIIGQAAIFGFLHAIQGPSGILITAYVGLVLAAVYFASGRNLWAPILAHGIMDSMSLTLMYFDHLPPGFIR